MRLAVNGAKRDVQAPLTVADLLRVLGVAPDGVSVAVNRRIVPHKSRATANLAEGDEVEIVHAAPGG